MSCSSDALDAVRRSISATVDEVVQQPALADYEECAEAMDIISRIERRILANQQHSEAAE